MTDTTTTDAVLSKAQVSGIFIRAIETNTDPWDDIQSLVKSHQSLQSRLDQAHWDAISRDQTIETLRAEVERLREVLEDARHSLIHADELTLEMLREWLAGQAYISHTRSLQVYDGNLNVHWERYTTLDEIIAIIDEGRIPHND